MNIPELKEKIDSLTIWKKGDQRAPHKPLLILLALVQIQSNNSRFLEYGFVREKLIELLREYGPVRKSYHPEEPFVRLKNDGIWELNAEVNYRNPSNKLLLANNVAGGFTEEVFDHLKANQQLFQEIAHLILDKHFPETIHEDIIESVGLDFNFYRKRKRNPYFRERILRAYGYSCAICGFNVRLAHTLVGVEAAHIKWHQAGGPDEEENGLALCSLHHKLFDRGVFTISKDRRMIVSQDAHGTQGFKEMLLSFHGQMVRKPIETVYTPHNSYLDWHVREVFKGPERYVI
ncbi:phosphorothioated DNA-binding restriction endonuclease [Virgibacillus kekensis]|uniref:Phosphorothioated DNA-binding restriction endonuclease n=1 Tax=Virgibacillus kekensis TaxID=202261 RepID=A0ABV9DLM9_9BACI